VTRRRVFNSVYGPLSEAIDESVIEVTFASCASGCAIVSVSTAWRRKPIGKEPSPTPFASSSTSAHRWSFLAPAGGWQRVSPGSLSALSPRLSARNAPRSRAAIAGNRRYPLTREGIEQLAKAGDAA
jgi:hypothetical protein